MINSSDGWAVGSFGRTMHWDGQYWRSIILPADEFFTSIFMIDADDGWIVGTKGTIIHWNGETWSIVQSYNMESLVSLHGQ